MAEVPFGAARPSADVRLSEQTWGGGLHRGPWCKRPPHPLSTIRGAVSGWWPHQESGATPPSPSTATWEPGPGAVPRTPALGRTARPTWPWGGVTSSPYPRATPRPTEKPGSRVEQGPPPSSVP